MSILYRKRPSERADLIAMARRYFWFMAADGALGECSCSPGDECPTCQCVRVLKRVRGMTRAMRSALKEARRHGR